MSSQPDTCCPLCGNSMIERDNRVACSACSYSRPAIKPRQEAAMTEKSDRWERWLQPLPLETEPVAQSESTSDTATPETEVKTPTAPPKPPPSGTMYSQYLPAEEVGGASYVVRRETLYTEKLIYFSLAVVKSLFGFILSISVLIFAAKSISFPSSGIDTGDIVGQGLLLVGLMAIGVLLTWYVLFGDVLWLKWGCLILSAISLIRTISAFISPYSFLSKFLSPVSTHTAKSVALTFLSNSERVFELALAIWFISIIWRDIKRQEMI